MMPHLRDLCSETRQALKQNRNLRCPQAEHYALFQMVTTLTRFSWTSTKICVNKEDFKGPCSQVLSNFLSDLPLCAVKHAALSESPSRLLSFAFQALIQMYWSWHSCGAMKGERLKQKGSKPHTLQTQQLCKNRSFVRSGNNFVITNPQPSTGCTVLVWRAVMESLERLYYVTTPRRGVVGRGVWLLGDFHIFDQRWNLLWSFITRHLTNIDTILRGACFNDGRVDLGGRKGISFLVT